MSAYRPEHTAYEKEAELVDRDLLGRVGSLETAEWDITTPVVFEVSRELAASTDLPLLSVPLPLVSRRVADALVGLGGFDYSVYAVQLVDGRGAPVGNPDDFVLFQVRTVLDVLDRTSPGVEVAPDEDPVFDGMIFVHELAIVRPPGVLPACFRVKDAERFRLVFNDDAKAALDGLGPRGFVLVEVPSRDERPPLA